GRDHPAPGGGGHPHAPLRGAVGTAPPAAEHRARGARARHRRSAEGPRLPLKHVASPRRAARSGRRGARRFSEPRSALGLAGRGAPPSDRGRARPYAELGVDPVHMVLDGLLTQEETPSDLAIGVTGGDQLHDLGLPLAEHALAAVFDSHPASVKEPYDRRGPRAAYLVKLTVAHRPVAAGWARAGKAREKRTAGPSGPAVTGWGE